MNNDIKKIISKLLSIVPDKLLNIAFFIVKQRMIPRINNPRTLNEKIVHIKLYDRNVLREIIVDRLKVRSYVFEKTKKLKFSNLIWSGDNFTIDVWNALPTSCVLKANHGSGMIMFLNKKIHDYRSTKKIVDDWLKTDYSIFGREWFYKNLKKYIVVESLLNFDTKVPPDFKFFCFNGKVNLIQVDYDRFDGHKRNIYDREFNKLNVRLNRDNSINVLKPDYFNEALEIAEILSEDFDFIRVDLFILKDGVYFGELTNTPGGGFERFYPRHFDFEFGSELQLTDYEYNK